MAKVKGKDQKAVRIASFVAVTKRISWARQINDREVIRSSGARLNEILMAASEEDLIDLVEAVSDLNGGQDPDRLLEFYQEKREKLLDKAEASTRQKRVQVSKPARPIRPISPGVVVEHCMEA